jgi:hypothetical protein
MKELLNVRQHPEESRRRWFVDPDFELIVWVDEEERITTFELSYDLQDNWRAIRWTSGVGGSHHVVDDGEDRPHRNAAPLLRPGDGAPPPELIAQFRSRSAELEPAIRDFVVSRLEEYQSGLPRA